jgi:iron(III) transport system ATP-binding protein
MLVIDSVHLSFDRPVLEDVNLQIEKGAIVGIVGASGGGKSSLLKIIAGLLDPTSGSIYFNRKRVLGPSERLVPGHEDIQLVNQDFGLDNYHTVYENILQKMLYLPRDVRSVFCEELIDLVDLNLLKNQQAISLSGGEQQRLAIARALAAEPEVLLLDEPFSHLDAHLKMKLGNYIQLLAKRRKMTCILVSHEGQDILEWCTTIHFFHKGKLTRSDSPEAFYHSPTSLYEGLFFGPLNQWKKQLFRPTAYRLTSSNGIPLTVKNVRFAGVYWINEVKTLSGNSMILYAPQPLNKNIQIEIID